MDITSQVFDEYINRGWMPTMINIWQEKIRRLKIVRSGALHASFTSRLKNAAEGRTITMTFLKYGIYQALGTGYGYVHNNGGDLDFLKDETKYDYRHKHRLDIPRRVGPAWGGYMTSGKPRKRRDWYSAKLYLSVMNLKEDVIRIMGERAALVICEALEDTRRALA